MSFRCGFCGNIQPIGTKGEKIVTKIRIVDGEVVLVSPTVADYIVKRREIVEEKLACSSCARKPVRPIVVN